eukprot:scpid111009/ scgid20932/ 
MVFEIPLFKKAFDRKIISRPIPKSFKEGPGPDRTVLHSWNRRVPRLIDYPDILGVTERQHDSTTTSAAYETDSDSMKSSYGHNALLDYQFYLLDGTLKVL